jgi:hypothetical protein
MVVDRQIRVSLWPATWWLVVVATPPWGGLRRAPSIGKVWLGPLAAAQWAPKVGVQRVL